MSVLPPNGSLPGLGMAGYRVEVGFRAEDVDRCPTCGRLFFTNERWGSIVARCGRKLVDLSDTIPAACQEQAGG